MDKIGVIILVFLVLFSISMIWALVSFKQVVRESMDLELLANAARIMTLAESHGVSPCELSTNFLSKNNYPTNFGKSQALYEKLIESYQIKCNELKNNSSGNGQ